MVFRLLAVGDIVASTCKVMSAATIIRPEEGTPFLLTRANTLPNKPSSAAALALCPTSRVQPASDPRQPTAAHSATASAAVLPSASRAASAKGADEESSALLGIMPIITEELST